MTAFDHPGLLYHNTADYLAGTTAFARAAVAAGEPVLVAVPGDNLTMLRDELTDLGDAVTFADMAEAGRNPGRIIPGVLLAFAARHPGRRVAAIGEPIWPSRSGIEYPACAAHEALINAAFAGVAATVLCPYDAGRLDPAWVDDAWHTHPVMIESGQRKPSPWYTDGVTAAAAFNQPLPPIPDAAATWEYTAARELSAVRAFARGQAREAGLLGDRGEDFVLAVNELAENTIRYAPGGGVISTWTEPGRLVCQVDDGGHLTDPLVGRIPPSVNREGGRGLLLANQVCDLVRIHTEPGSTSIRLHMLL
ncbi:anti-sigma regulatory factor (Ser/Thr protein kinase) [Actinoplanes octamycinicus]|uniref:Anti-sigma regulatory factor (Ser/Thr protein kinase) n=1 Tax=Actinoplanes octamycinicus TaxID=135948 RepID=A0A7W7M8Y4_9ACTN|nr:anti-sigma factor RsbA family regulatory protein [Actinoplanes octamycinicus]MBB4741409.1 anti-sigma regulatory factor (Ser/Thr protein kinase) [Actinoplanes octamycinicus]GIE62794.1 anti-sigma regulatory factor [Actinoplanes octamycinicus]